MRITKLLLVLNKVVFRIIFISWLVFVTFSSLSSFEGVNTSFFNIPFFDKIVHFGFYFVMVVSGMLALKEQCQNNFKLFKSLVVMLVFAITYGIIIEILQASITVSRQGDVFDVMANTLGALLGMVVAKLWFSSKQQLK